MTSKPAIGWIGLGKMGLPMAAALLKAGYPLTVFNRSPEKAKALNARGAALAADIAALAAAADIVISMISDDNALAAVATDGDGVIENAKPGTIYVDMSTVSPAASSRVAELAEKKGIKYLRAPVSGSTNLAESGNLTVIASGPKDAFEACSGVFGAMAAKVYHVGAAEEARVVKLAINMMVGVTASMLGEALAFGGAGGLEWEQIFEIISGSTLASPIFDFKMAAMEKRDFAPAFTVKQMAKDFDLVLDSAREANVPMPITSTVRQYWSAMIATGKGDLDFFAYVTMMEELAGLRKPGAAGD